MQRAAPSELSQIISEQNKGTFWFKCTSDGVKTNDDFKTNSITTEKERQREESEWQSRKKNNRKQLLSFSC